MWYRFPVVVHLLIWVLLVIPLAHANPPDPTWIGGLWDAHDYDDVVVAVLSIESGPIFERALVTAERSIVWHIAQATAMVLALVPPPVASIRAPPIA